MMNNKIIYFIKKIRGLITGLNAVNARFDVIDRKIDTMRLTQESIEVIVRSFNSQLSSSIANKLLVGDSLISATSSQDTKVINRVGFLLHSSELINHYSCIWDTLPKNSFDVILHGDAIALNREVLSSWECAIGLSHDIIQSRTQYIVLVSNHPVSLEGEPLIKRLAKFNIRFMYAAGKSGWNLSDWNNLYDLILSFGPYHAKAFANCSAATVVQMGYPRFDRYFNTSPDINALKKQYDCALSKKTIVWLPTWKELSSVGYFDQEISSLTSEYNVVVKLHPLMVINEPERIESLKKYDFTCLITDSRDNLPLYQLADFMLFDYGGPPFAGIYANKNLILLNVPNAEYNQLTGAESPDICIRKNIVNVNSENRSISRLLDDAQVWIDQEPIRQSLCALYFAPYYGFSSIVAASTMMSAMAFMKSGVEDV